MGRRLQRTDALETLEAIYKEHAGRVRWALRSRGVGEDALDDLVHDVFLAIHRRLPDRDASLPTATWVVGVARNVAFSHRRAKARANLRIAELPEPEPWPAPDEALAAHEAWLALAAFLDELEPAQREVFVLVELVGMSVVDVGQSTGVGHNTLYSRLRLARRRFGERFVALEDPAEKAAFLDRVRTQSRPDARRRRRAWAAVVADVGAMSPVSTVTPLLAKLGLSAAGLGLVVAVGMGVGDSGADSASPAVATSAAGRLAPTASEPPMARRPSAVPSPVPPATREAPAKLAPAPVPLSAAAPRARGREAAETKTGSDNVDTLAQQIRLLRAAKAALTQGDPHAALDAVDRFVVAHGDGQLGAELHRIELDAACALEHEARIGTAVARLRELGRTVDHDEPCEKIRPPRKTP